MSYLHTTNLRDKTGAELAKALAAIPAGVTSLDLRYNDLDTKSGADLAKALAVIPAGVTNLNLGWNNLDTKTGAALAKALAAIPAGVTSIDLGWNGLGAKTGTELAKALAAIPAGVTSLDLRGNDLGWYKTVAEALAAIPVGVNNLDLTNNLFKQSGAELAQAFAEIPAGVTSLNLRDNFLGNKSGAELVEALAAIPAGVTSLDLTNNFLGNKSGAELAGAFAAIHSNVLEITLFINDIQNLSNSEIINLGQSLSSVMNVSFQDTSGNLIENEKTALHNSYIGARIQAVDKQLIDNSPLSEPVIGLVHEYINGGSSQKIKEFVSNQSEQVEARFKDDMEILKTDFLKNHAAHKASQCFNFARRTGINSDMSWREIIDHAKGDRHKNAALGFFSISYTGSRSLDVLIKLGVMNKSGDVVNKSIKKLIGAENYPKFSKGAMMSPKSY